MAKKARYHQASNEIPGWKKLSTEMKGRYFCWRLKSEGSWTGNYTVVVSYNAGKRRWGGVKVATISYQFDNIYDAEECRSWWREYNPNCSVHILQEVYHGT